MTSYGISEADEQSAFLATLAVESRFEGRRESFNYSVDGLKSFTRAGRLTEFQASVWGRTPRREAVQQVIANEVYANRMGNGPPLSGDGWKYRGWGLIQLTGKAAFQAAQDGTGHQIVDHPEHLQYDPWTLADVAAWYWAHGNLSFVLKQQGFVAVCRAVNVGNSRSTVPSNDEATRVAIFTAIQPAIKAANRE